MDDKDIYSYGFDFDLNLADNPEPKSQTPFRVNLPEDEKVTRIPYSHPVSNSQQRSRTPVGKPVNTQGSGRTYDIRGGEYRAEPPVRPTYGNGTGYQPQQRTYPQPQKPQQPQSRPVTPQRPPERKDVVSQRDVPRKHNFSGGNNGNGGKGKKIAISVVCVILVILLAFGGFAVSLVSKINYDDSTRGKNEYISDSELAHSGSVENILIIGSDARGDVSGMRSDTMILASIDKKNKQLKLTSFLRDSLVYIPELGKWNKLNAACSYGGADMVIDTIEYNFKVKIDSYVLVDFEVFTEFINALGGVTVSGITKNEVDWLKRNVQGIGIQEGTSHLTGGAALWYCRVRKIDSDFKRTERQRKVIGAVIEQIKHTNPVTTLNAIKKVMPMISTDIKKGQLMGLGVNALLKYLHYDIYQAQVPAEGTWWDARYSIGAVLEMKIDKNAEILKDFVYNKQEKKDSK